MGQTKQRVNKTNAKQRGRDAAGHVKPGEDAFVISAGVWGQLAPLDKIAREKTAKWGDTLPSLVAPELAGRFEAAYERLKELVEANDVVGVNKVAAQLMRAWDVLEQSAEAAGRAAAAARVLRGDRRRDNMLCDARVGGAAQETSDVDSVQF